MKFYAINGSPRKNYNTAELLHHFLDGAKSTGDDVKGEAINLYDLNFKGCTECMVCKLKNGNYYEQCGYPDEIHNLLREVSLADGIAFGSPIYFHDITGELRCFLERLFYPYTAFQKGTPHIIAPKRIRTAFLYTMNVSEQSMLRSGYPQNLQATLNWTGHILGYEPETLYCCDTLQYKNYDLYHADAWDIQGKKKCHETVFPLDCQKAFELGKEMAQKVKENAK